MSTYAIRPGAPLSTATSLKKVPRSRRNAWPELARGFSLAFALTAFPVFVHILLPPLAIVLCVLGAVLVSRFSERDVPVIVLTANVFSNIFVSIASAYYQDFEYVEHLKVYSFITTLCCNATVSIGYLPDRKTFPFLVRRLIFVSACVLAVVGVYFLLGLLANPRNSVIYLRNTALPILIFQSFLIVGVKHRIPVPQTLLVLLGLVTACGFLEFAANDFWRGVTNAQHYAELNVAKRMLNVEAIRVAAAQGEVVTNPADYSRVLLFNTALTADLGIHIQRLNGPNFNAISFAYLLSILISFLALQGYVVMAALATPLLLATSAKGAMTLLLGNAGFAWLARRASGDAAVRALAAALVLYGTAAFLIGYSEGDFHVLGLLGGVNGFLSLPLGHTLGDGGNHSIPDFSQLEWGEFQRSGASNVAVESAFGVMLYQLGVCAAAVIGFYLWIARVSWRFFKRTGVAAFAFTTSAIAICLVNGLFQEDAYFVPLSLPFVMGLAGLTLGAAARLQSGPIIR